MVPQLPEGLPSEEAGAGNQLSLFCYVFVLHLSLNWSCRGLCSELHSETDQGLIVPPPPCFLFCCFSADSNTPSSYSKKH